MPHIRHTPSLLVLPFLLACGGADTLPEEATTTAISAHEHAMSELPSALRGEAPPLSGTDVNYHEADPAAKGYLSLPEGEGPFPAVILIHEWNGLVDRVREVADALAAEGYVALAADVFSGETGRNPEENMALVRAARENPEALVANLDAAVVFLRARPDVTGRVGAMGWCFGGGVALTYGLDGVDHEATAIFYGSLLDDPEVLSGLRHEVYGTFARLDQGPSPQQVDAFALALEAAGVPADLHIYDDVSHGFWLHVDQDPDLRAIPALDAWERLKSYLGRTLR